MISSPVTTFLASLLHSKIGFYALPECQFRFPDSFFTNDNLFDRFRHSRRVKKSYLSWDELTDNNLTYLIASKYHYKPLTDFHQRAQNPPAPLGHTAAKNFLGHCIISVLSVLSVSHDFLQSDYLVDDLLIVCDGFRGKPLTITCQWLRLGPMNHPQQLNPLLNDLVQSLSDRPQDALEQLSIRGVLLRRLIAG